MIFGNARRSGAFAQGPFGINPEDALGDVLRRRMAAGIAAVRNSSNRGERGHKAASCLAGATPLACG